MLNVLLWLLAVEAIGLAAFPLCYYLLPRLRDRGYAVSKPLGILLIAYVSWILSVLRLVPSVQLTILGLLVALGGLSGWYGWRHRRELLEFVVRERKALIAAEVVFLAVFIAWAVYRAYDPFIDTTEQPMDFAFLNASVRSTLGVPEDPWLRGESISYYYFGYWMMSTLSKLTAVPTFISYNLSLALIPALAAMGIFGLVANMVRADSRRLRHALVAGAVAAVLLVAVANLEGVLEFMRANGMGSDGFWSWIRIDGLDGAAAAPAESWRPQEFNWWWHASRVVGTFRGDQVVDYTINEFPFFSFILGDLHPHVMSVPFVILFLTLCWSYLRTPPMLRPFARAHLAEWRAPIATVLVMGLVLGGLGFTNIWDLPVFSAMLVGIAALRAYSTRTGGWELVKGTLPFSAAVIGLAVLLILPYLMSFTSQVPASAPVAPVGEYTTRLPHLLVVWGLFFAAIMPFIFVAFWRTTVDESWGRLTVISLFVVGAPFVIWAFLHLNRGGETSELTIRLLHIVPVALPIAVAVYSALWLARREAAPIGQVFALSLAALGLLLIMGPELLLVDDAFGGAHDRMNTVFKLYYQGWILLAASAGYTIYYWSTIRERAKGAILVATRVWATLFVVLLFGAAYYPLAAISTRANLDAPATLDGLSHLLRFGEGAEYRAIEFIRGDAGPDSAVLEAFSETEYYLAGPFGRVSSSTGVPTILGWRGHEAQWRGSFSPMEGREEDVAAIYETMDVEKAKNLLEKYSVDYVYVGRLERETYGEAGLGKFSTFMETVFDEAGTTVYRLVQQGE
jgi:YYY domain-containing protein